MAAASESIQASLLTAVALSGAVMVMWPILRCRATSALPYQCTEAPGTCNAAHQILLPAAYKAPPSAVH